jgi:DNA repair protein RecN (Recombination protein N)
VDSASGLLDILKNLENKLQEAHHLDEEIKLADASIADWEKKVLVCGKALQESRETGGKSLMLAVGEQLQKLGMPNAKLDCEWTGHEEKPDMHGLADLRMTFRANAGSPLLPLDKAASGGELSRVNFCLKSLTAIKKTLPTLIYDEADTGISGEIALQMARMMRKMAQEHQLICITHLPQVAAAGKNHFRIFKEESEELTESKMVLLENDERIQHLAAMLSGNTAGAAALGNAHELLRLFAD